MNGWEGGGDNGARVCVCVCYVVVRQGGIRLKDLKAVLCVVASALLLLLLAVCGWRASCVYIVCCRWFDVINFWWFCCSVFFCGDTMT